MYHRECAAAGGAPHSRGSALSRRNRPRGNPKGNAEMGPRKRGTPDGAVPTIFARPDTEHLHSQLAVIAGMLPAGAGDHRKGVPVVEPMRWDDADDAPLSRHPGQALEGGSTGAQAPRVGVFPNPEPCSGSPAPSLVETHDDERSPSPLHGRELPQAKTTPTRRRRSPQKLTAKSNQQGPRHGAYATRADSNEVGRSHRAAFEVARPSRAPTATPTTTSPG